MIRINDLEFPWREGMTLGDAVKAAQGDSRLAPLADQGLIMLNGSVVGRSEAARIKLREHDVVVLLTLSTGG